MRNTWYPHRVIPGEGTALKSARKPISFSSIKKIMRMIVIVIVIGFLVNILISLFVDFDSLGETMGRIRIEHILVPCAVYLLIYLVDSLRLKLVLRQFSYRIGIFTAMANSLLGYFFSYLTPMATGGQPFQIYHLKKNGIDAKTSTNIMMSRFIEYIGSAVILTLIFIPSILPLLYQMNVDATLLVVGFVFSFIATIITVLLFIRPDWIGGFLVRIEHSFLGKFITRISKKTDWATSALAWSRGLKRNIAFLWKKRLPIVLIDIALCILILGLQVFSFTWVLVMFAGAEVNFLQIFVTVLLLNLVVYYIPSPGASGGLEGVFTLVFSAYTAQPQSAFVAVVVWRLATYYLQIFLGLGVFLLLRKRGMATNSKAAVTDEKENAPKIK